MVKSQVACRGRGHTHKSFYLIPFKIPGAAVGPRNVQNVEKERETL